MFNLSFPDAIATGTIIIISVCRSPLQTDGFPRVPPHQWVSMCQRLNIDPWSSPQFHQTTKMKERKKNPTNLQKSFQISLSWSRRWSTLEFSHHQTLKSRHVMVPRIPKARTYPDPRHWRKHRPVALLTNTVQNPDKHRLKVKVFQTAGNARSPFLARATRVNWVAKDWAPFMNFLQGVLPHYHLWTNSITDLYIFVWDCIFVLEKSIHVWSPQNVWSSAYDHKHVFLCFIFC